ncbi:MAG TPA: carotenoid oxygenase family protein [Kouleothrix sp.]|nr:carotenoid oxygenase family protein [Kouleothrix sp.]
MGESRNTLVIWLGGVLLALLLIVISSRAGGGPNNAALQQRFAPRPTDPNAPTAQPFELPQVHPARWGHARAGIAWGAGLDAGADSRFFDRTLRLDLQTGETRCWQRERATQLEPLFVPRPGAQAEDDGVLLVPTLADGDEGTRIGVVDAASMQCLALLHAPQVIPFGFHAAWVP